MSTGVKSAKAVDVSSEQEIVTAVSEYGKLCDRLEESLSMAEARLSQVLCSADPASPQTGGTDLQCDLSRELSSHNCRLQAMIESVDAVVKRVRI